jgi:hypothetical protein
MSVKVSLESETSKYEGFSVIRLVSPYTNETNVVKLYPHEGCAGGGRYFTLQRPWSDDTYCLGCDYQNRYSIGD